MGTGFHYATLVLWVEAFRGPVLPGTLAGFLVGACTNYLIARRFVFNSVRPHRAALPRFLVVAGVGATVNTLAVAALLAIGAHYLLGQVIATGAVLLWNYAANKHWTFAH